MVICYTLSDQLDITSAVPPAVGSRMLPSLPQCLSDRILRGEFIDLEDLLSDNLCLNKTPLQLVAGVDGSGKPHHLSLQLADKSARRTIRDITSWFEAWTTYMAVIVSAAPTRVRELLGYQYIILTANKQFHTNAVLCYDSALHCYVTEALAPSTRRLYASAQASYHAFCRLHHYTALPATEQVLAKFVVYLADIKKLAPVSIKPYLAAVQLLHIEQGLGDPFCGTSLPQRAYDDVKHTHGTHARNVRLPLDSLKLQKAINMVLTNGTMPATDRIMLAASFSLAFFGFLRCSELLSLTQDDISVSPDSSHLNVVIKRSNTDPFRQGCKIFIGAATSQMSVVCPVRLTSQLLALATSPAVFTFQSGEVLTRERLATALQDSLARALIPDAASYNTHSFRIGAATAAAAAGMPDWLIKTLGRWSSDAYLTYVRTPEHVISNAARQMCM